ncbi:MAG TPA: response regulator transcription factor, partial [Longilinea sp.]|nr:response regulator transcription factor [Longilinea sp.]
TTHLVYNLDIKPMSKILVVDDDAVSRAIIKNCLESAAYDVLVAANGSEALTACIHFTPDLIILDLEMPVMDGMDLLDAMEKQGVHTHVIILTAHGSFDTAVEALRHRADDYILKPINPQLVLERVKALIGVQPPPVTKSPSRKQIDQVTYQLSDQVVLDVKKRVLSRGDKQINLTPSEMLLLHYLILHPEQVVSMTDLVKSVQGYELNDEEAGNIIRPVISRLRKKMKKLSLDHKWIICVRSAGYMLDMDK